MGGLSVIVNADGGSESDHIGTDSQAVSWVLARVNPWEEFRDTNYEDRWDEYYRLWRGIWADSDKAVKSERSKIIVPALQQAIEAAVAELEEATFGKGKWFDTVDDVSDDNIEDIKPFRDLLQEDLDKAGARAAISEVFLNSALYGTGIGKLITKEIEVKKVSQAATDDSGTVFEPVASIETEISVELVPVSPYEFVIDPAAKSIEDSLGCAHIFAMPKHQVLQLQADGIYKDIDVGGYVGDMKLFDDESKNDVGTDQTKIIEYHGLFPKSLLDVEIDDDEELVEIGFEQADGNNPDVEIDKDTDLVESIVIIANDSFILRAVENQNFMKDRAFIAYQHDTVPNRFWGRGIAEKGYWPQKTLDAEVRGRIDAMALSIRPLMGIDATRIPRGVNLTVEAGKTILTNGDPSTVLRPFNFGAVNNNTFHQSGEMERMIQMGTGSMDSATPVGVSPRNSTASGMSMISSGSIKRQKRTLANIGRHFIVPFIEKAAWRMMQFDPNRYETQDTKFVVASTLGLMAREIEQQQLTALLQTTEPNSTAYWMLIKGIYENSSMSDREEMVLIAKQKLQESMQPPQPSQLDQMKAEEIKAKAEASAISLQIEKLRAETERMRVMIEAQKADGQEAKDLTAAMLNIAKAEEAEVGTQLNSYQARVDAITAQSTRSTNDTTRPERDGNPPRPV